MFTRLILVSFVLSSNLISLTYSEDSETEEEEPPKSCQKYLTSFVEGVVSDLLICLGGNSTFKVNNIVEYATRSNCLLKCIFQRTGAIGADGYLDDVAAALYFEDTFAPSVVVATIEDVQTCFQLASGFNPKDYWCKSYHPFFSCAIPAIIKGLIPFGGDCVSTPTLGILFSAIKYLAPDSPKVSQEMQNLRRAVALKNKIKCLDSNCTRMYEYKRINNSQSVVLYDKNMQVISIRSKGSKPM